MKKDNSLSVSSLSLSASSFFLHDRSLLHLLIPSIETSSNGALILISPRRPNFQLLNCCCNSNPGSLRALTLHKVFHLFLKFCYTKVFALIL